MRYTTLSAGAIVALAAATLTACIGVDRLGAPDDAVAVGIRPEKLRLDSARPGENSLRGTISERSYVGVATQYTVATPDGQITVFVQNADATAAGFDRGAEVEISFDPDAAFIVDDTEEEDV